MPPGFLREGARTLIRSTPFGPALAVFMLFVLGAAAAADETCAMSGETARVAAVVDDLDVALEDGRTLRLAGIDPARGTPNRPDLGEDARRTLERWLVGREVVVGLLSPAADRWDRFPALVSASEKARQDGAATGASSVNAALLDGGWARARPESSVDSCFRTFLATEARARAAGLGLWADPYYAITDADDRKSLAERAGAMALVEGRLRLGEGRGRSYLRLGRAASGFVATLSPRSGKMMARTGLDIHRLVGARLRIRGFLDDRFGPRIDVTGAEQIEVLDGSETAGSERLVGPPVSTRATGGPPVEIH